VIHSPRILDAQLAGVTATRLAAVTLVALVTVIEMEQLAATAALASLRLWAHRAPKAPEPREESKQNRGPEEELRGRRKKSFQVKSRKKTLSEENGIPNRPQLRITILALTTLLPQIDNRGVRAKVAPKTTRELAEVRFVNGFQYHCHGPLHDLVFQHQYGQRSLASVPFGYPNPPRRLRPILPEHPSPMQILDSFPQVDSVFGGSDLVDPRRRVFA
jgi:hypothetical protein